MEDKLTIDEINAKQEELKKEVKELAAKSQAIRDEIHKLEAQKYNPEQYFLKYVRILSNVDEVDKDIIKILYVSEMDHTFTGYKYRGTYLNIDKQDESVYCTKGYTYSIYNMADLKDFKILTEDEVKEYVNMFNDVMKKFIFE